MAKSQDKSEKPVLWIVEQYAVPTSLPGFVRQFEHAQLLQEDGWKVRIVASPYNHKTHLMDRAVSLRKWHLDQNEDGVDFTWVYSTPYVGNGLKRYINMASFVATSHVRARGRERPDVILGSSPHLLSALSGWLMAKRFRVPFIMEVRDLWPESLVQLGLTNPAIVKPLRFLESFLYRKADAIVCLTEGIRQGVIAANIDESKLVLVPNGVDVKSVQINVDRDQFRRSHGWDGKFVAGWIGAHGTANHLHTIVHAAALLHQNGDTFTRFVLIGDGPEKPVLQKLASSLPNVEFMNPVPKSNVFDYLSAMDAGLIVHRDTPAVRGARPNKLFDYMAVGLCVISDLQGETQDLIEQAGCGLTVSAMDSVALAQTVSEMAADPSRARSIGARGIPFLHQTHDRTILVTKLAELLDRLVVANRVPVGRNR